ncbi:MAG TPA: hypothetical protein DF712_16245, partial [Balneola sp.]|nr:hypothetical protein [Balneola sp.]
MLEQAVIDAKELREAAMKTAEDELLKKYSSQIKEAVDNLLNDEEPTALSEEELEEAEKVIDELEMKALDGESNSDLDEGEMVEINLDELKEELQGDLEEAKKPDENNDGIPDYAQDGKGENDLGKADDLEE